MKIIKKQRAMRCVEIWYIHYKRTFSLLQIYLCVHFNRDFYTVSLWQKLYRSNPLFLPTKKKEQNIVMVAILHTNVMHNGPWYPKLASHAFLLNRLSRTATNLYNMGKTIMGYLIFSFTNSKDFLYSGWTLKHQLNATHL